MSDENTPKFFEGYGSDAELEREDEALYAETERVCKMLLASAETETDPDRKAALRTLAQMHDNAAHGLNSGKTVTRMLMWQAVFARAYPEARETAESTYEALHQEFDNLPFSMPFDAALEMTRAIERGTLYSPLPANIDQDSDK